MNSELIFTDEVERGVSARNPWGFHTLHFHSQWKTPPHTSPYIRVAGASGRTGTVRSTCSPLRVERACLSRDCVDPWRVPYGIQSTNNFRFGKPVILDSLLRSMHADMACAMAPRQGFLWSAFLSRQATRCGPRRSDLPAVTDYRLFRRGVACRE